MLFIVVEIGRIESVEVAFGKNGSPVNIDESNLAFEDQSSCLSEPFFMTTFGISAEILMH
jgi:hypothetical protein